MSKVYLADFKSKQIVEKATMEKPFDWLSYNDPPMSGALHQLYQSSIDYSRCEEYENHLASLTKYPASWLTEQMDGKEMVEGVDFYLKEVNSHAIKFEPFDKPEFIAIQLPHTKYVRIVCVKAYEFEGTEFNIGDIGYHCWGKNIPNNWRKATDADVDAYIKNRSRSFTSIHPTPEKETGEGKERLSQHKNISDETIKESYEVFKSKHPEITGEKNNWCAGAIYMREWFLSAVLSTTPSLVSEDVEQSNVLKRPYSLLIPTHEELAEGLPYFNSDKENNACVKGAEWVVELFAQKLIKSGYQAKADGAVESDQDELWEKVSDELKKFCDAKSYTFKSVSTVMPMIIEFLQSKFNIIKK